MITHLPIDGVVGLALEAHERGDVDGLLGPFIAVAEDWDEEALSAAFVALINAHPEALVTLAIAMTERLASTDLWDDAALAAERSALHRAFDEMHGPPGEN